MKGKTISQDIVEKLELISMNFLNPGVSDVRDRNRAIETFRELNKTGILPHPFAIEEWALNNGWSKEEARNLRNIAQSILEGKRLRKSP
jgi:hypothetical protein